MEADIEPLDEANSSRDTGAADLDCRVAVAAATACAFGEDVDLVLVLGPDASLLHASSGWVRIAGETTTTSPGRAVPDALQTGRLASVDWETFERTLALSMRDSSSEPVTLTFEDPEKGRRHLEGRLYRPDDRTGNIVVAFHDVTTGWAGMAELANRERCFRMIAEAADDMVTETNAEGCFTYVSPVCTRVLGYTAEELIGRSRMEIQHDEERDNFIRDVITHWEPGEAFSVAPHRLRHKDGSWVWVEATGVRYQRPDGELRLVEVARDITSRLRGESARQQLEEQLRSSQKFESLGVLAGGIAHDFNNCLTPIVGTAGLLSLELPAESPLLAQVELIRKAARRATDLTAQMLSFAGGTEPHQAAIDISETIRGMHLLLESAATHRAQLVYKLSPDLPRVTADDGQLAQVVLDLVASAAGALGKDGGCIEISTGQREAASESLRGYYLGDQCTPGCYVYVEVADDGVGIDAQSRDQSFDPVFSTRFTGRWPGLAEVVGFVKGHGGALRIDSSLEGGTRFRILLPTESTRRDSVTAGTDSRLSEVNRKLTGTFLVVDDDEDARQITSILLERAGFDVLAEEDGSRAIETFRRHVGRIVGIVLDNNVPGLSGAEVSNAIREIAPQVPIILVSGYERDRISSALLERGDTRFLHKPFDSDQLLAAVHELLDLG